MPHIALSLFFILVTIAVIIVLSITIAVKRRITGRTSRLQQNSYLPCGHGASRVWKEKIEKGIDSTIRIRTLPQTFGNHYNTNFESYKTRGDVTFLYRAKAVDELLILKRKILSVCPGLAAPPIHDVRIFLLSARECAMRPPASHEHIEEYCHLYLWARHDLKPFGEAEYSRMSELQEEFLKMVFRAAMTRDCSSSNVSLKEPSRSQVHPGLIAVKPELPVKCPHPGVEEIELKDLTDCRNVRNFSLSRLAHLHVKRTHSKVDLPSNSQTPKTHQYFDDPAFTANPETLAPSTKQTNLQWNKGVGQFQADTPTESAKRKRRGEACGETTGELTRRPSCRSDGSQTALIETCDDPITDVGVTESRSGDQLLALNAHSEMDFGSSGISRKSGGQENEGVNC